MIGVKISLSGKSNLNIKTIRRQKKGRSCNKVLVAMTIISILICFFLSLFELPWLLMEDLVDDCLLKTLWLASSHSSLVWASLNYFAKSRSLLWHVIRLIYDKGRELSDSWIFGTLTYDHDGFPQEQDKIVKDSRTTQRELQSLGWALGSPYMIWMITKRLVYIDL